MLGEARKQSLSGWLEQATAFYNNLMGDADLMEAMVNFGYHQAKLQAEGRWCRRWSRPTWRQWKPKRIRQRWDCGASRTRSRRRYGSRQRSWDRACTPKVADWLEVGGPGKVN